MPVSGDLRDYLMSGVVERIARSAERDAFVLRGGALTRIWLAPERRPARDLDFVGDFAFDVADTRARLERALAAPVADAIAIGAIAATPMWEHTAFPGVRAAIAIGLDRADLRMTIDIGFGDPLVPPATAIAFAGSASTVEVRAVRPETQLAWKLHGLAEQGAEWRPKDLADAWRIAKRVALDDARLADAITAAFGSRGFTRAQATELFALPHWATKTARVRWPRPEPLADAIAELHARLAPVLAALPTTTGWPA